MSEKFLAEVDQKINEVDLEIKEYLEVISGLNKHQEIWKEAKAMYLKYRDMGKFKPQRLGTSEVGLQVGDLPDRAYHALVDARVPMHIEEILIAIGEPITDKNKHRVSAALTPHVRNDFVFTSPSRGTYALIKLQDEKIIMLTRAKKLAREACDEQ